MRIHFRCSITIISIGFLVAITMVVGVVVVTPVLGQTAHVSQSRIDTTQYPVSPSPELADSNDSNVVMNISLHPRWKFSTHEGITKFGIARGSIYFGVQGGGDSRQNHMYAVDQANGEVIWKAALRRNDTIPRRPIFYRETIYFSSWPLRAYALDADTGSERWVKVSRGSGLRKLGAVANQTVYIGTGSDHPRAHVFALDYLTGDVLWTFTARGKWASAPVVKGDTVYVGTRNGTRNGTLYAIAAGSGNLRWFFNTHDHQAQHLTVHNETVYFATQERKLKRDPNGQFEEVPPREGEVFALDTRTGQKRWSISTNSPARGLQVEYGNLYLNSIGDRTHALDATTGAKRWSFTLPDNRTRPPAVAAGGVFVGSGNTVYVLNSSTGGKQATFSRSGRIMRGPRVVGDTMYIAYRDSDRWTLYAVNASTPSETTLPAATTHATTSPTSTQTPSDVSSVTSTAERGSGTNGNAVGSPLVTPTKTGTATQTIPATGPGFGLAVSIGALVLAGGVLARRRE